MNKREYESKGQKYFTPNKELLRCMEETLQIKRKAEKLKLHGEELSGIDKIKERNLRTNKTRILDKIIFQSMANLTFFLDSVSRHPQLQSVFDDDLKDLFGIRRNNSNAQNRGFMFGKLMGGILTYEPYAVDNKVKDKNNFRIVLLHALQYGIFQFMTQLIHEEFNTPGTIKIVLDDLSRAVAWINFYASKVEDEDILPKRTFDFESIK